MTKSEAMALGRQHQDAGRLDEAERLFRQVLATDPAEENAKYRLAVISQLQGRNAEAIALYRELLQVKPDAAQVHNNLALALVAAGQLQEAAASYAEAIRLRPDFAEAFNNLGNLQTTLGNADAAIAAYRRAVALKPQYAAAWINLGRAHLARSEWDKAVRCFREALALQPDHVPVLNALGEAYLQQGNVDEAGACFRRALHGHVEDAEAYYNLARVASVQKRWDDAVACLQNSLACHADSAKAHGFLADIFYCHLGRYAEALRSYQRVLALSPDDAKARLLSAALSGSSALTTVPADYVAATYDPLAGRFDQYVQARGDRSPEWLKDALGPPPPERGLAVLDLGCGTGLAGLAFRDWADRLVGVDLSANMLAAARQRGIYDELIHGDVLVPLQQAATFDLILASDVLLYLGDLLPLFNAVRHALRPGGRFAFTVDLLDGPGEYRLTPWVHFAHSRAYLEEVARKAHLQEVNVRNVVFPRDAGHAATGLVVVLRVDRAAT
jgi:predicted TPR repeat methyltransferase